MSGFSSRQNPQSPVSRLIVAAWMIAFCAATTGCVRRRLTVRTNPPGAQVFVDDQEIGTTPCSAAFVYYGTRKITLMKDGYRTETIFQKIPPPWYEIPPLDFLVENVIPFEKRDERIVDVQLVPEELVPQQKLLSRAQMLRDGARTGNGDAAYRLHGTSARSATGNDRLSGAGPARRPTATL
jgi:hypothetical protein